MSDRYERGGVVWPILLILLGGLLLADNMDLIQRSFWSLLFQLWPAILVAIGIDILIPRRSIWGTLIVVLLVLGVFAGSYWLSEQAPGRTGRGIEVSQSIEGIQAATVSIDPAVGRLEIDGGAPPGLLVEGSADPIGQIEPRATYSESGGRGSYHLTTGASGISVSFPLPQTIWDLSLAEDLPILLNTDMGVGETLLNLTGVQLEALSTSFGVGRAEIALPALEDLEVDVDGGIGEIILRVPSGADVRVQSSGGLTSFTLPGGYIREGDSGRSPGASGSPEISIRVDLGIGMIRVQEWTP